jgi:hypothetical protein
MLRRYVGTHGHLPKPKRLHEQSNSLEAGLVCSQNAKTKIQFNGAGRLPTYIRFKHIQQRIARIMNLYAKTKNQRGDLIPVIVTVIVAVLGTAGILNNLRLGNETQDRDNARMITSAAVSRVGAIEIPSELPVGRRQPGDST